MHILIVLSYAFSVWMIVDAYKRGADHYWYLIIFFPFGEWIYFFTVKLDDFKDSSGVRFFGPRFKCATCKHCGRSYDDGVTCMFSGKPYFKNPVHIDWCKDYEDR
jgi:hypothetical protein